MASLCWRVYPYWIAFYASIFKYICWGNTYWCGCLCWRADSIISYWSISYSRSSVLVFWASCSVSTSVYIYDPLFSLYQRISSRKSLKARNRGLCLLSWFLGLQIGYFLSVPILTGLLLSYLFLYERNCFTWCYWFWTWYWSYWYGCYASYWT